MRESRVETYLRRRLRDVDRRIEVLKFTVLGQAGYHDRLVLLPGARMIYVELKRPSGQLRKLQLHRHRQIAALGFASVVVDSLPLVDALTETVRRVLEDKL